MANWLSESLEGDSVRLRVGRTGDEEAIVGLMTDPDVREFVGGPQDPERVRAGLNFADVPWGNFVVTDRPGDRVIGTLSFDRKRGPWEVSFQLERASWGRGLMSEGLCLALGWYFSHQSEPCIAVTQAANLRTRALLERAGAALSAEFEQYGLPQRQYDFAAIK